MKKNGIVIVSFGTSYHEEEETCINPLVKIITDLYKDYYIETAFTSSIIIKMLKKKGRHILTVPEAVEKLIAQGLENCIILPLHFIKGHEYENKIIDAVKSLRKYFKKMIIGDPLLSSKEDLREIAEYAKEIVSRTVCDTGKELILFMGHGTDHEQDAVYEQMQNVFTEENIPALLATVAGKTGIADLIPSLQKKGIYKVHLFPFMLVAGDHAHNDMAGDAKNSWTKQLLNVEIEAIPYLIGMGESSRIQNLYISHLQTAIRDLQNAC